MAIAAASLLGGCSSDGGGDWLAMLQAARVAWDNRDSPVSLADASSIPFATLGLRIDGGREQILILATDVAGDRLWTSSAKIALTVRNGRIVRTAGLGGDLSGYFSPIHKEDWTTPHRYSWTADFNSLGYYSVAINCDVRPMGPDAIVILEKRIDTIRVEESCRSDRLDWSFTNTYWVNAQSGRVWRSIEQIIPKGQILEIELLRPPLSPG